MSRQYTVTVEVAKTSGRFVSGDLIDEAIVSELEGANPSSINPEDSEYEVISWEVEAGKVEIDPKPKAGPDARQLRDIPEIRALLTTWGRTAGKSDAETLEAFKVPMQNLLALLGI